MELGNGIEKSQEQILDMVSELLSPGGSFELETDNQIVALKKDRGLINLLSPVDVHGSSIQFPNFYDIAIPDTTSDDNLGFQVILIICIICIIFYFIITMFAALW